MGVWGKVIGGVGGLFVGGPVGAVVGALAGHMVDKEGSVPAAAAKVQGRVRDAADEIANAVRPGGASSSAAGAKAPTGALTGAEARRAAFRDAVITLGAKIAKADGRVTRDEVEAFKRVFRVPDREIKAVGAIFDRARESAEGLETHAAHIAKLFRGAPQVLEELLGALYDIARADGVVHPAELKALHTVARLFNLPEDAVDRLRARFEGRAPDERDPYAVLGVSRDASADEIRAAWTRLARQHHPDRLVAQGLPEALIAQATQTMASINHAYDRIRERRGL